MKKLIATVIVAVFAVSAFSAPRGPAPRPAPPSFRPPAPAVRPGPGPGPYRPAPPRHDSVWGRGGRNFWPGFVGGLVGAALVPPPPPPIIVQPPVVIAAPERIWVPPVYGERPVYRAGIYVGMERYVVTPGYWTYR